MESVQFAPAALCREDGAAFAFGDDTAGQCRIPALPPGERLLHSLRGTFTPRDSIEFLPKEASSYW